MNINFKGKNNPFFGKKHSKKTVDRIKKSCRLKALEIWKRKGYKSKMSKINKRLWTDKDYRTKVIKSITGWNHSEKSKELMSNIGKLRWKNNKQYRDVIVNILLNARNRTIKSPNKQELLLYKYLNVWLSKQYKFVGNGKFNINGKCPDFIDFKNKRIIELFGDYWHKDETTNSINKRIRLFKKYGYDTLIVWGNELNDINNLKKKILKFLKENV